MSILEFPDKKGQRDRNIAKMDVTHGCLKSMAQCIQGMRELGADSKQIAKILRHVANELEPGGSAA